MAEALNKKYQSNKEFKASMDRASEKYFSQAQKGLYSEQKQISQNTLELFMSKQIDIYFFYGYLQPKSAQYLHQLMRYFFKSFNPHRPYSFVYFNNETTADEYNEFRSIFLMLPIKHYINLNQFIVVRSSFMMRAYEYITFGIINKYVKEKTVFVENAKQLCKRLKINIDLFVQFVPQVIFNSERHESFPNYIKKQVDIKDYRINIEGQQMTQQERKQRDKQQKQLLSFVNPTFDKETHRLQDYEVNPIGIPLVLSILIFYFKNNPKGLYEEGIFRKSVSIDQQNQSLKQLTLKNYSCIEKITNPHIIANLIKRFFSRLMVPVIPFQHFSQLMNDQGIADKELLVKTVINSLPVLNITTLAYLLTFLQQQVISKEQFNKMSMQNIAICFSPCLMRAQKSSAADLMYATKTVLVTKILFNKFKQIFGDKKKINDLYRSTFIKRKATICQQIVGVHFNEIQSHITQYDEEDELSSKGSKQAKQHIKNVIQMNQDIEQPEIKKVTSNQQQPVVQNQTKQYQILDPNQYEEVVLEEYQINPFIKKSIQQIIIPNKTKQNNQQQSINKNL